MGVWGALGVVAIGVHQPWVLGCTGCGVYVLLGCTGCGVHWSWVLASTVGSLQGWRPLGAVPGWARGPTGWGAPSPLTPQASDPPTHGGSWGGGQLCPWSWLLSPTPHLLQPLLLLSPLSLHPTPHPGVGPFTHLPALSNVPLSHSLSLCPSLAIPLSCCPPFLTACHSCPSVHPQGQDALGTHTGHPPSPGSNINQGCARGQVSLSPP